MNVSSWSKAFFLRRISSQESRVMPGRLWRPSESFVEAVILHFISFPHGLIDHIIYAEILLYGSFFGGRVAPFGSQIVRVLRWDCFAPSIRKGTLVCCPRGLDGFFLGRGEAVGAGWLRTPLAEMWRYHLDKLAVFGRKSLHLWSWCCVAWVQASKPYLAKHVFVHGCEW